ncbi:MAG: hypothetical protein AAGI66_01220 [Cyanobacteria bacterium P01_H01_bin.74]
MILNDEQKEQLVVQTAQKILGRLNTSESSLTEAQVADCQKFLLDFTRIACSMYVNESGIALPNSDQTIPLTEAMITQGLGLFAEGVYFSVRKCQDLNIQGDLQGQIMQGLAMEVYNQSKQVVSATYGQENTPDFQFSEEQQVEIILKAADVYLVACINDYEKNYGPINPDNTALDPNMEHGPSVDNSNEGSVLQDPLPPPAQEKETNDSASPSAEVSEEETQLIPSTPEPVVHKPQKQPAIPPDPLKSRLKHRKKPKENKNNKYGAIALLLSKIPETAAKRFLSQFSKKELVLIERYKNKQAIYDELDPPTVEIYVKQLYALVIAHEKKLQQNPVNQLKKIFGSHPEITVTRFLKTERQRVKQFVKQQYVYYAKSKRKPEKIGKPVQLSQPMLSVLAQHLQAAFSVH